jgi:hypothetical protein
MTDSWRNPDELPLDWMPLRRAAQKINRNDPCPCGSGKKYKKCCEAKDAARSSSPYAGMTMDEAMRDPGRHGDPRIIEKIPAEWLGELKLETLSSKQLQELARRLGELDRWDEAETALGELGGRADQEGIRADDLRAELVRKLLVDGKPDRVAALLTQIKNDDDPLFRAAAVSVAALRHEPDAIAKLEALLAVELEHGVCMLEIADMLRWGKCPTLALALLRAACFETLGEQDLDLLAEDAAALRTEIGLEGADPVVTAHLDLLDRRDEEARRPDLLEEKRRLNESLLRQLNETRDAVRRMEEANEKAGSKSEREARPGESAPGNDTVDALRRKVEELKAEIRVQQGERRELKQRLRSEEGAPRPARARDHGAAAPAVAPDAEESGEAVPASRPLRPVAFSEAFYRSLGGIEPRLVVKAQESVVRFAAYDPAMWHHCKKLADFADLYSLRIGIHHRLLLRRNAEGGVEARELVTRERHDAVVARYRG